MSRSPLGIQGIIMELLSNGKKNQTLICSLTIKSLWSGMQTQTFTSSTLDRCGGCGRFFKIIHSPQFQGTHRRLVLLESPCCCRFAHILMWSNTFRAQDWTENVITIVTRWAWSELNAFEMNFYFINSTDQRSVHVRCMASACSWKTILNSHELSGRFHSLPAWNHKNPTEPEHVLNYMSTELLIIVLSRLTFIRNISNDLSKVVGKTLKS